ncbi:MAG: hypothetical protein N5P05_004187 (plasmid) [Chroococcopsis gigantea SAG 12.99]|nr:hypothetical protein [Chroococcopsis gigantea SAG 12.99]
MKVRWRKILLFVGDRFLFMVIAIVVYELFFASRAIVIQPCPQGQNSQQITLQ